jgi:hypothetical protein
MKATLKSMVAKVMTAGLLAGALLVGAPKKAEAQVSVGVQFGQPVYQAYPAYGAYSGGYYGYGRRDDEYARRRWEEARRAEWERRQAWERHEQRERWEHERRYGNSAYGYYGR